MSQVDLRSDTATRPTARMREAMAAAEVGDDVFCEDPTILELESCAAELLGKEAALFVTSGTQGNLVALLTHCARGDAVILGSESHIYNYEGGGLSALGGMLAWTVDDREGIPSCEAIADACRKPDVHFAPARLLCLENTHNRAGGLAVPPDRFSSVTAAARDCSLPIHLDGARLFDAATKWDVAVKEYASEVDSVQICLSKGLGAPAGSLVCGTQAFVDEGRHWRKRLGGGMRQAGVLAAPGLIALREMRLRLHEDHANAALFAAALGQGGVVVETSPWQTNMVFFALPEGGASGEEFEAACAARGILLLALGPRRVRIVCHADVSREDVERAGQVVLDVLA
ncbi:MAG: low-specificity L-threonine aldolase [Lentisphaerae bacterium]|jgi:threonine aldolase|nr:low-specificity L-threonine aldolase [Lentisphaerota bacterium]MBT4819518.1 low-specificity L-threonine aldolase [Lentisphaerota bacterium]MBT5610391.1 low-specificity L-threonine aldolase [Lentisphaerota bacterium]MBT7056219.1 low-specificity L-threonine aldolase [Lentisphaerota bacterium]MBT7841859.1 low-specificity L-threonine aldolase [Lentisphaerota bacterium]